MPPGRGRGQAPAAPASAAYPLPRPAAGIPSITQAQRTQPDASPRTASRCQSARSPPPAGRHLPCGAPAAFPTRPKRSACPPAVPPALRDGPPVRPPNPPPRPGPSAPPSPLANAPLRYRPRPLPAAQLLRPHYQQIPANASLPHRRHAARPPTTQPAHARQRDGTARASRPGAGRRFYSLRFLRDAALRSFVAPFLRSSLPTLAALPALRSFQRQPAPLPAAQVGPLRGVSIGGGPPNPLPSCPG